MRRKRRKQRAILLREGDYCCDQAQFAAPSPARGDSSQKLFCLWTASNQQHHPERCKYEQSDGKQGEQPRPRFNLFDASFGEAEIPLGVAESLFAAEPEAVFFGHRFGAQPQVADQIPCLQLAFFVARPTNWTMRVDVPPVWAWPGATVAIAAINPSVKSRIKVYSSQRSNDTHHRAA
jgi:hypothetical protein